MINYLNWGITRSRLFTIYCCGLTSYGLPHVGHIRTFLIALLIKNLLKSIGYTITLTINWTDLDPKIGFYQNEFVTYRISALLKKISRDLIRKYIAWEVDFEPSVSKYLHNMEEDTNHLVKKNLAIKVKDGIKVIKIDHYLSNSENKIISTAGDFYLWRDDKNGIRKSNDQARAIPGWHLECASMIKSIHGSGGVDLHLGGSDLIFPHHVNEDMIFEKLCGNPVSRNWLHVALVTNSGIKMSKSLKNHLPLKQIKNELENPLRIGLLSVDYNKTVNFSIKELLETKMKIKNLFRIKFSDLKIIPIHKWIIIKHRFVQLLFRMNMNIERTRKSFRKWEFLLLLYKYKIFYSSALSSKRNFLCLKSLINTRNTLHSNRMYSLSDSIRTVIYHIFNIELIDTPKQCYLLIR